MYFKQKTLRSKVSFEGIGIHTGERTSIVLHPSEADTGIVITSENVPHISWKIGTIIPESAIGATVLKIDHATISTIEHVMAALGMLNVDNVAIHVRGEEFPILDGSSVPFVNEIIKVGFEDQNAQKLFLTPRVPLTFVNEQVGSYLEIEPALKNNRELSIEYDARFDNPLAGPSSMKCIISEDYFIKELAPARTFGYLAHLPFMKKHGLSKGASLENTVVIADDAVLTQRRFNDECLRHKVLDLLGDLTLLGKRLVGTVKAKKTSHAFNRLVIKHFITNPDAWTFV